MRKESKHFGVKRFLCSCSVLLIAFTYLTVSAHVTFSQDSAKRDVALLKPGGSFLVGHLMLDWVDSSRREPATVEPNDRRQIPVQIWYPARSVANGKLALYRPRIESFRSAWGRETVDFISSVKTTWIESAPVNKDGPFGVFIFSHGWGSRSSSHGTFLSNLASHGYIVVGLNHPYMGKVALSDGKITEPSDSQFPTQAYANQFYADDVIFAVDQMLKLNKEDTEGRFKGAIDGSRIIAGGHSSGFPAVSGAAVRDKRIKGLISFDAGVPRIVRRRGLDVPILLVRAETKSYTDLFSRGKNVHPKGTIYDVDFFRAHRGDFYDLLISDSTHSSVYDEYLFAENETDRNISIRNHKIIGRYAVKFMEMVLKGTISPLLNGTKSLSGAKLRIIRARREIVK
jgi:hypothetical protein